MKPVDQTTFGHPGGNCFSACVASLLGLPIEDVPYFMDDPPPAWHERLDAFLAARGLYALHFQITDREIYDRNNLWPKGFYILNGKSSRGDHAVVARGAEVAHDPHPTRGGLTEVDGFVLIVPFFGDTDGETTRWMVRNASAPARREVCENCGESKADARHRDGTGDPDAVLCDECHAEFKRQDVDPVQW